LTMGADHRGGGPPGKKDGPHQKQKKIAEKGKKHSKGPRGKIVYFIGKRAKRISGRAVEIESRNRKDKNAREKG